MNTGNVLILGCGPAGLLAAHAVERLGGEPTIVSRKLKSPLSGAQYLHEPIPGLTGEPDGVISTFVKGTEEGYAAKVYGDPKAPTSWNHALTNPTREVWDLRAVYDKLWGKYQGYITDSDVTRYDLHEAQRAYPLVISTIPATALCAPEYRRTMEDLDHHRFEFERMSTIDYAEDDVPDNTVLYSGDSEDTWYRMARIFGHGTTEWSRASYPAGGAYLTPEEDPPPRIFEIKRGIKVKGTTCDCFPEIKRAGRYGTWRKGYLTHHAFEDATCYYQETFG